MPGALVWLVVAVGLAAAEALTGDMFLLMLSGGALATAGSHWIFGWPLWADGASFLVVSVLLLVLVRPALRRRLTSGPGLLEPVRALEGRHALVLDQIDAHAVRSSSTARCGPRAPSTRRMSTSPEPRSP